MSEESQPRQKKCEECVPGLPIWMATFTDMVTLLLTFFVLLLSFAKTETAKYEAALGSIRNAFGGNALKHGKVIQLGKSPDDSPTMLESENIIRPFPIDFLSTEGVLDKLEINRESKESLDQMREDLETYGLADSVSVYEEPEGIKVKITDKIYFEEGQVVPTNRGVTISVYEKMIKLIKNRNWILIIEGHASGGEQYTDQQGTVHDALTLSAFRAQEVLRSLTTRGVPPEKLTTVFYGDSRPLKQQEEKDRRVEFIIRKRDLGAQGRQVPTR